MRGFKKGVVGACRLFEFPNCQNPDPDGRAGGLAQRAKGFDPGQLGGRRAKELSRLGRIQQVVLEVSGILIADRLDARPD